MSGISLATVVTIHCDGDRVERLLSSPDLLTQAADDVQRTADASVTEENVADDHLELSDSIEATSNEEPDSPARSEETCSQVVAEQRIVN